MKGIWAFLGSVKLTFWLLVGASVLFFIGAHYAHQHYSFFAAMNRMRLQDWLLLRMGGNPAVAWWLPILLAALLLLALNTLVCALSRLITGLSQRSCRGLYGRLIDLAPTIIHCLFVCLMAGHLLTVTLGSWARVPVEEGKAISVGGPLEGMRVTSMRHRLYPEGTKLAGRAAQSRVTLRGTGGETLTLSFLHPQYFQGCHIFLDTAKHGKKRPSHGHEPVEQGPAPKLSLLVLKDPGFPVIVTGFLFLLIVMVWYFIEVGRRKKRACA